MSDLILPGYARVSDVIRKLKDFSHIDPEVLENKGRIGTKVHDGISDDFDGEFPILQADEVGYMESFLKWRDSFKPVCHMKENRFYCHKHKITGQIDALLSFPPDYTVQYLVDFKTSANEDKLTWPLQAHLYAYLLRENGIDNISPTYIFLKLDKKGDMPKACRYTYSKETLNFCMNLIKEYWAEKKDVDG